MAMGTRGRSSRGRRRRAATPHLSRRGSSPPPRPCAVHRGLAADRTPAAAAGSLSACRDQRRCARRRELGQCWPEPGAGKIVGTECPRGVLCLLQRRPWAGAGLPRAARELWALALSGRPWCAARFEPLPAHAALPGRQGLRTSGQTSSANIKFSWTPYCVFFFFLFRPYTETMPMPAALQKSDLQPCCRCPRDPCTGWATGTAGRSARPAGAQLGRAGRPHAPRTMTSSRRRRAPSSTCLERRRPLCCWRCASRGGIDPRRRLPA